MQGLYHDVQRTFHPRFYINRYSWPWNPLKAATTPLADTVTSNMGSSVVAWPWVPFFIAYVDAVALLVANGHKIAVD